MPSRLNIQMAKINLHDDNLKKRINAMIQDSIQRGLVVTKPPITLDPVVNENENKENESVNIHQERINKAKSLGRPINPITQVVADKGGMGIVKAGVGFEYKNGSKIKL